MTSLDDEFLPEEAKKTAIKLRKTTANLVRQFQDPKMQLKLKTFGETRSTDYAALQESFEQMKNLWWTKLTTPLEEVNSIKEQLRILQSRTQKLREIRDQKKEHLQKYEEESKEQRAQREAEINSLRAQNGEQMQDKAKEIGELDSEFRSKQDALENQHKEEVKELKKKIDVTEANLNMVKQKNKTDEMKLRDEYRKNDRLYGENINAYDIEMRDKMRQKEAMQQEFNQVNTQLTMIQDEHKQRIEERKKREEILAIMKKKNDEQLK